MDPEELDPHPPRYSTFRLEVTLAVGYQRHRAGVSVEGKWERSIVSVLLLIFGAALVFLFVYAILWKIL